MFHFRRLLKTGFYGGVVTFVAYPFVKTDTKFHYKDTEFNRQVLKRSGSHLRAYMPGFGISGKIRQIFFNVWFAKDKETPIVYERTNLVVSDGGTISIDWAFPDSNKDILIAPSLENPPHL